MIKLLLYPPPLSLELYQLIITWPKAAALKEGYRGEFAFAKNTLAPSLAKWQDETSMCFKAMAFKSINQDIHVALKDLHLRIGGAG